MSAREKVGRRLPAPLRERLAGRRRLEPASAAERHQCLLEWNDTACAEEAGRTCKSCTLPPDLPSAQRERDRPVGVGKPAPTGTPSAWFQGAPVSNGGGE